MQSARVRIIDFQDALKATRSYDLVGLLNDRDTDSLLGEKQYVRLLKYFRTKASRGPNFLDEYDRTLLQRDLKVAGRFCKLADERGLEQYRRWVPGTVRRIGRTLARLAKRNVGDTSVLLGELSALLPEIQAGAATPWAIEEAFND